MTRSAPSDVLGPQARAIWAKTGSRGREWLSLPQHMADSAAMAEHLFDQWLAPGLKRRWAEAFPGGTDDARLALVFLAGAHDVGKASPVFAAQVETMAARNRTTGLSCPTMDELRDDRRHLPHATVSHFALQEWLVTRGTNKTLAEQMAGVVGAHHGKPVSNVREARRRQRAMGRSEWNAVRVELLDWLDGEYALSDRLTAWSTVRISLPVQVGMSGLVIMADWLASNQDLLPLRPLDGELSPGLDDDPEARWSNGWVDVAMPAAWDPDVPTLDETELYRSRFEWKPERVPHPLQREVVRLISSQRVGLLIIESAMGSGKTEAAFAAAEILAAQWGAHGLFVALPTQATTDAMFSRMLPWLRRLPQPPADVPAWAITLAHGKAAHNREYADEVAAVEEFDQAHIGMEGIHDDDECSDCGSELVNAVAHQWFRGRKRRMLANFGIGTIDQLLMAGLQQRHLMLRHLALAGKVIIVDEVHASDEFMNVYLDSVLEWLGHYGVPVILLSATLTKRRKVAMLEAYAPEATIEAVSDGYPQLTWVDASRSEVNAIDVADTAPSRTVQWEWMVNSDEALVKLLERKLRDGGCALVVRNTVGDAQRCVDLLAQAGIAPVTLAHSRFLAADRAGNDEDLRRRFGPGSGVGSRPERAIVVATQVVEQSLDVDFDLLITDLAPMDLLFQRIGRLHRHHWRERPPRLTESQAWILAEETGSLPLGSNGSHHIYADHVLHRTALVLKQHGPTLTLPNDIAPLVERALGDEPLAVADDIDQRLAEARQKHEGHMADQRQHASAMCLPSWSPEGGTTSTLGDWLALPNDPSEARMGAMVRDTTPTLEVIVVPRTVDGTSAIVPPWMPDGGTIDTSSLPDDDMARRIATWAVQLPPALTRWPSMLDSMIEQLGKGPAKGWAWHRHRLLKGQLFLPMDQLTEGSVTLTSMLTAGGREVHLRYSPTRGLEEVKDDLQPGG